VGKAVDTDNSGLVWESAVGPWKQKHIDESDYMIYYTYSCTAWQLICSIYSIVTMYTLCHA
jgi:hypothetical protein